MNIYLLTQNANDDYDTYDSCVVVAKTAKKAKEIYPSSQFDTPDLFQNKDTDPFNRWKDSSTWANNPNQVTATLVGKALDSQKENTIICASFNAG